MGRLADRKLLTVAVVVTVSGATAFGIVGWAIYGSSATALLAAVTVLVEGAVAILAASRWDARRRRRGAHRRRNGPGWTAPPAPQSEDGWVPDGWDLPWDERRRGPTEPPD